jgi:hypothetical protein
MTNTSSISVSALRKLYTNSRAAKAAFDHFAQRKNSSAQTTVDRLQTALRQDGHDAARSDIIDLFRELANAGCGHFVVGRKGHPSRFEWLVSLVDVGRSAAGEAVKVEAITESERGDAINNDDGVELIEHRYRLRADLDLRFELPVNLTSAEASRIADFVRTLPFA